MAMAAMRSPRHGNGFVVKALPRPPEVQVDRLTVGFMVVITCYTIWLFNIAMENCPFMDGLPIKNGNFPWLC